MAHSVLCFSFLSICPRELSGIQLNIGGKFSLALQCFHMSFEQRHCLVSLHPIFERMFVEQRALEDKGSPSCAGTSQSLLNHFLGIGVQETCRNADIVAVNISVTSNSFISDLVYSCFSPLSTISTVTD